MRNLPEELWFLCFTNSSALEALGMLYFFRTLAASEELNSSSSNSSLKDFRLKDDINIPVIRQVNAIAATTRTFLLVLIYTDLNGPVT